MGFPWKEVLLLCACVSVSLGQSAFDCCTANLMESKGRVIIESEFQVVTKATTVRTVRVRQCSVNDMYIQFWKKAPDTPGSDFPNWQLMVNLDLKQDGMGNLYEFNLNPGITIQPEWRLGLKGANSQTATIPVPYNFDDEFKAKTSVSAGTFQVNKTYQFSKLNWPISFSNEKDIVRDKLDAPTHFNGKNILFCEQTGCPGLSNDAPFTNQIVAGPPGVVGPAGPVGPPGTPGSVDGNCTCKDPNAVSELQNMGEKQGQMQKTLKQVEALLAQLARGNSPTGNCPDGFIGGTFGVGSCYMFVQTRLQIGLAIMKCQERGATLLRIEEELEQRYLLDIISKLLPNDNSEGSYFWTAGMSSNTKNVNGWVWVGPNSKTPRRFTYENWHPSQENIHSNGVNHCMAVKVDKSQQLFWYKKSCPEKLFYVCEIVKDCL